MAKVVIINNKVGLLLDEIEAQVLHTLLYTSILGSEYTDTTRKTKTPRGFLQNIYDVLHDTEVCRQKKIVFRPKQHENGLDCSSWDT